MCTKVVRNFTYNSHIPQPLPSHPLTPFRLTPRSSLAPPVHPVPSLHGQYVFNVFTLELNTHVNTRIHFGPPHSEYV
eukprot:scaffold50762_cov58-Phaeocystis_antarctica.AAC.3